jgi:CO/xanthine dehydrogenase FAD-binding subunit
VFPTPFEYAAVTSVAEATQLLSEAGDDAKVLAGGQSLVAMMNLRLAQPSFIVDINGIEAPEELLDHGFLVAGPTTRQASFERAEVVHQHCPLLPEALAHIGNVRVRNRGTICGNLAHADPSSELAVAGLAVGAEVTAQSTRGSRRIPASALFVTYLTTSLEPDELITEARFPVIEPGVGWAFLEMARRAGEFAILNVAALIKIVDGRCESVSLVFGGVGDRPVDLSATAFEVLVGEVPSDGLFARAAERCKSQVDPKSDVHAPAEYRREMVAVYGRRALAVAAGRAAGGDGRRG